MTAETTAYLTYSQLKKMHSERLRSDKKSESTVNNAISGLNDWMKIYNCSDESIIGSEFYNFKVGLEKYLNESIAIGKSDDSLRPLKSRICNVKETFDRWQYHNDLPLQFPGALTTLKERKGLKWKPLAKLAFGDETKARKIMNWALGENFPRADSVKDVIALEEVLEVPKGTLTSRLPKKIFGSKNSTVKSCHKSEWAEKQSERTKNKEKFKHYDWTDEQELEFKAFVNSKYSIKYRADDGKTYKNNGIWRTDSDNAVPTAVNRKSQVQHYYGFLVNKAPDHLKVVPEELSLALLVDEIRVQAWLTFIKERADHIYNGYVEQVLNLVKMITRPESGFLWANLEYRKKFPIELNKEQWREKCKQTFYEMKDIILEIKSNGGFHKTRNPRDLLSVILDNKQPMKFLFQLLDEHEKERPLPHQKNTKHAAWYRDEVLINLMIACPLRMKTVAQVTYKENGSGTLQRHEDGSWNLNFQSKAFKNQSGAAKNGYYIPLPKKMWELLDKYINVYRLILLATYGNNKQGIEHDVFLNNVHLGAYKKGGPPRTLAKKALSISARIRYMFKAYLNISAGGHAFRHIIATDWLKNHPDSFMIVADILHDKIETIIGEYAHLKPEHSLRIYHEYIESINL